MTIFLKLGGSVITDKEKFYTSRSGEMERLSREIYGAIREKPELKLIIGNGGGSYPHQPAKKGELVHGIKDAWQLEHLVETHRAAGELNHLLVSALVHAGVPAISIRPSSAAYTDDREIVDFNILLFEELLKINAVPVVHGDVLVDLKQGCSIASTEKLFSYLAKILPSERIVIGTNVDGVLDGEGNLIPEINGENFKEIKKHLKGAESTDVTGGMLHKVESMLDLAKLGCEILIVNAHTPGNVKKALLGERIGTRVSK